MFYRGDRIPCATPPCWFTGRRSQCSQPWLGQRRSVVVQRAAVTGTDARACSVAAPGRSDPWSAASPSTPLRRWTLLSFKPRGSARREGERSTEHRGDYPGDLNQYKGPHPLGSHGRAGLPAEPNSSRVIVLGPLVRHCEIETLPWHSRRSIKHEHDRCTRSSSACPLTVILKHEIRHARLLG
jgi:hypothetical protein